MEAESLRLEANRREELAYLAREKHDRQLQTEALIQRQLELDTEQLRLSSQWTQENSEELQRQEAVQ